MTAELELTIVREAVDLGYVAGFAISDRMIYLAGGTSSRGPMVLASSNARHFERRATPRELGLRAVVTCGDTVWTCGEYGQLARSRDHGATWELVDTGTDACLFGLAVARDGAVWCVGDGGYAARVHDRLERVELDTTARLTAVYAHGDETIVLGHDGALRRWAAGKVTTVQLGPRPLAALAITAKHGTWIAVGDGGFIARSPDGAWWSRPASGIDSDLEACATLADGRIVAVGARGCVLASTDDGRTWRTVETALTADLWAIERFGDGLLVGGDGGAVAKLAPPGDRTWEDRIDVFSGEKPLDLRFANGPDGFIAHELAAVHAASSTDAPGVAIDEDEDDDDDDDDDDGVDPGDDAYEEDDDDEDGDDEEDDDDGEADDTDREAFQTLGRPGTPESFAASYGVAMPGEVVALRAAGANLHALRVADQVLPDVGDLNLFELLVRRDQHAPRGTGLVEAFCGVFCVGRGASGDTYHLELYEWDGPRQVVHHERATRAFTGVVADSLDSLVYLAALTGARRDGRISDDAFALGLRKLRGRVAPTEDVAIADETFATLDPKRRDTEFFFYRARWICALLEHRGAVDDIPALFNADFNQVVPEDQLPARLDACARFIPTALYSMWRAFLFDEPELARYLEIGRRHDARLVRDAAALIDELRAGRNELGTIRDIGAWLAAFRALDLDPRRAGRRREIAAELDRTPPERWGELAWRWLGDGIAHRMLLERLDAMPAIAEQLAGLEELHHLGVDRSAPDAAAVRRVAAALVPELEAVLVGSLARGDDLAGALAPIERDEVEGADVAAAPEPPAAPTRDLGRLRAALAMTERALALVPGDADVQFTHAMLLLDAGRVEELLARLPRLDAPVRINVAVRMGKSGHHRFAEAVDAVLSDVLPDTIVGHRAFSVGSASVESYGEVAEELFTDLADSILEHAPDRLGRLVPALPADVSLLSQLAYKAIQADQREHALTLYDRVLVLPIPAEGDARKNYLHALNNACVQAHAVKAFDAAARIADRAQPVAHENPYIYHAAACAYAAVGEYAKALQQVKLAIEHDYAHLGKVEVDTDLGPLLEWPEFKALFRDWHARQEGN